MNRDKLIQFLLESNNNGYVTGEEKKWKKEKDGSTTIIYKKGDFKSEDNFFGGEPYGGRLVVYYKNKPYWIMVYYGFVTEGVDPDGVYKVLRGALMKMPEDAPFRGPKEYKMEDSVYINNWTGDTTKYSGEEEITQKGILVYKAKYAGGMVDIRKGV